MKRLAFTLLVIFLAIALIAGCSSESQQADVGTKESQEETQETVKSESLYEDGIYYAETEDFDDHGWKAMVTVIVENGEISNVFYDEIDEEGNLKTFEAEYATKMEEKSGAYPLKAFHALEESLVDKQNVEELDVVSGATHSSDTFKGLVTKALDGSPATASGNYADGLYKVYEDEFDDHGWKSLAAIIIKDGKIKTAFFDQISEEDGRYKTADDEYAKNMEEKSKTTPAKAHKELIEALVEKQNPEVDTVTGATGTSETFKELMEKALSYANK